MTEEEKERMLRKHIDLHKPWVTHNIVRGTILIREDVAVVAVLIFLIITLAPVVAVALYGLSQP